jgi:hypothetical protein
VSAGEATPCLQKKVTDTLSNESFSITNKTDIFDILVPVWKCFCKVIPQLIAKLKGNPPPQQGLPPPHRCGEEVDQETLKASDQIWTALPYRLVSVDRQEPVRTVGFCGIRGVAFTMLFAFRASGTEFSPYA